MPGRLTPIIGIPIIKFTILSDNAKKIPLHKDIINLDLNLLLNIPKEKPTTPLVNKKKKPSWTLNKKINMPAIIYPINPT